jgi:hypothetical protein
VKPFAKVFSTIFTSTTLDNETVRRREIHREWDRQRALATGPADLAEIDTIFARNL